MIRRFIEAADLTGFLRAHRPGRRLSSFGRLAGETRKGAYRITFDDSATEILYAWSAAENYWPAGPDVPGDPFAGAGGAAAFAAWHAELEAAGVRVPRLHVLDQSRQHYPADLALVEDLPCGTLDELLARDPAAVGVALAKLGDSLRAMHNRLGTQFGKVADGAGVGAGAGAAELPRPASAGDRPEDVVARRALAHLAAASVGAPRLAAAQEEVTGLIQELHAAIRPRAEYRLVHGELHPSNVLLDESMAPVITDIEDLTYFDVEWEHAFLRMVLEPEHYARLGLPPADEARIAFYDLAQALSLIEGPLRIAATDFPDREWMLDCAEHHLGRVLAWVN